MKLDAFKGNPVPDDDKDNENTLSEDKTGYYLLPEIMVSYDDPYAVIRPILDDVYNPTVHGFHYILAGGRTQGKHFLHKKIFEELRNEGKLVDGAVEVEINIKDLMRIHQFKPGNFYVISDVYTVTDGQLPAYVDKIFGRPLGDAYVILVTDQQTADRFVNLTDNIRFFFKDSIIRIPDFSIRDYFYGYSRLLDPRLNLKLNFHVDPDFDEDQFYQQFSDYIATNEKQLPVRNRELARYLADFANQKGDLVLPPDRYKRESPKEVMADFIGMERVKSMMNDFENMMIFRKRAEIEGGKLPNASMHMMFLGNPGTGKTTVARSSATCSFLWAF